MLRITLSPVDLRVCLVKFVSLLEQDFPTKGQWHQGRWMANEIAESILKAPYLWSDLLHIAQPDKFPSLKMFEESINQERIKMRKEIQAKC